MAIQIEALNRSVEYKDLDLKHFVDLQLNIHVGDKRVVELGIWTSDYYENIEDSRSYDVEYGPVSVLIDGQIDIENDLPGILTNILAELKLYIMSYVVDEVRTYVSYNQDGQKVGDLAYGAFSSSKRLSISVWAQFEDGVDYDKEYGVRIKEPIPSISIGELKRLGYELDDFGVSGLLILNEDDAKRVVKPINE